MRTTIEIDEAKLVKLKKMAAERGERGFSVLINETLERYLDGAARNPSKNGRRRLQSLIGSMGRRNRGSRFASASNGRGRNGGTNPGGLGCPIDASRAGGPG
ncbi:MAG: hypothetical protein IPI33_13655 [Dehalococcoidia bacterium]|nr:hypothetical protein [Dehalococcoidia bacterium]